MTNMQNYVFPIVLVLALAAVLMAYFFIPPLTSPAGRLFANPDILGCSATAKSADGSKECNCIALDGNNVKCTTEAVSGGGTKAWCTTEEGNPAETHHCQMHGGECKCKTVKEWRDTVQEKRNLPSRPPAGY